MNYKNNHILNGIKYWFKGPVFVIKHFSLFKYLIIPLIINFIIIMLLFYFGWHYLSAKLPDANFISPADKTGFMFVIFWCKAAFVWLFHYIIQITIFIVSLIIFLLIFIFSATITGAPFYDILSQKIENLCGFNAEEIPFSFNNNVLNPFVNSLKMSMFEFCIIIISFPLNWIPFIGNILYLLIISYPLAISFTSYSTERRSMNFRSIMTISWKNKYDYIGFGFMAFISMIPFGLNLITFPLSVAGGTLLFIEKMKAAGNISQTK